jgi:hypothetical protein
MKKNADDENTAKEFEKLVLKKYVLCAKLTDRAIRLIENHYGDTRFQIGSPLYIEIYKNLLNTLNASPEAEKSV